LKLTGPDLWKLIDVKSTSVWSYTHGGKDDDYRTQMSIYRYLAIQNNYKVEQTASIWMIFTDWSAAKAKNDPNYPQTRIVIKEIDLWGEDETLKYLGKRIALFNEVEQMAEKDMPQCTDEELWSEDDVYKVMKGENKRSMKNCSTVDEAEEFIGSKKEETQKQLRVELVKGGVKRCRYCTARNFCSQYNSLVTTGRSEEY